MQFFRTLTAAGLIAAAATAPVAAAEISGAGSSFAYPIYAKWIEAYKKETGVAVDYRSVGSADGIRQVQSKEITFGASDMPLGARELEADGLIQFPTVVAGVVVVINVDGVKSGELTLDGATLARIFLGEIRSWNDAAIRKLNPNAKLPSQTIVVVRRADGSGTTFAFTDYLSKVSADWKSKIGSTVAVEWPTGVGANGNEGVAASVARTKGAIGYVEYVYATQQRLTYTRLINKDGKAVAAATAAFAAAAASADWEAMPGFAVILTNQAGENAWPIAAATFVLMHRQPNAPAATNAALKFFAWTFAKGGKMAEELDYVPMPANVVGAVQKVWATQIKDPAGKPVYAISR